MKKAQSQTCAREEVHGATQGIPSWAHRLGPQALGAKRTCLWRSPYGKRGGDGEGEGGGAGHVETVPSTPSVRVVGQEQTVPPVTWTFGPTDPTDGAGLVGSVLAVFPLMVHNEHDNEIATVPPAT